jgi:hypothetical protein
MAQCGYGMSLSDLYMVQTRQWKKYSTFPTDLYLLAARDTKVQYPFNYTPLSHTVFEQSEFAFVPSTMWIYELPTNLGLLVASTTVCLFVHVARYRMSFKSRSHTMLDLTYTTIHGDADSKFNHSPGMDPKFDQISRTRQGGSLRQGCQSDRGRVAVVPHTAVAQPRHK